MYCGSWREPGFPAIIVCVQYTRSEDQCFKGGVVVLLMTESLLDMAEGLGYMPNKLVFRDHYGGQISTCQQL